MNLSKIRKWLGRESEDVAFNLKEAKVNGVSIRVPPSFAGILPALPDDDPNFSFEPLAHLGLELTVRPGALVYDVGASYGVMSTLIAKLAGERGQVHAFEANLKVMEQARELAEANGISRRVHFTNSCVGDASGGHVEFHVVPGYGSVASTRNEEIFKFRPDSETVKVPLVALDDYARDHGHTPDVIKIDIEGSEYLALLGARRILQSKQPDLVIETHGLELLGIGGTVRELCELLDSYGYRFFDMAAAEEVTAAQYAERFANPIGYVLASRRLADAGFAAQLAQRAKKLR